MYSENEMVAVDGSKVQGPVAGPLDFDLMRVMRKYDIPVAYSGGNKYVKISDAEIIISWDIHR